MSNLDITNRLRAELEAFEAGEKTSKDFAATLVACIEGMEGLSNGRIEEMKNFQYEAEVCEFHDEDERIRNRETVISDLMSWIGDLDGTSR